MNPLRSQERYLISTVASTKVFLALKHDRSILRQSSNPVCGFSMMEQVRLRAVWPMEIWLGNSMKIQGWTTIRESYSRALEQGPLIKTLQLFNSGGQEKCKRFAQGARWERDGQIWMSFRQIKKDDTLEKKTYLLSLKWTEGRKWFDGRALSECEYHGVTYYIVVLVRFWLPGIVRRFFSAIFWQKN